MANNPNATKREMEVSWDDWNGKVEKLEHHLSRPVERDCHKGGENVTKEDLRKEGEKIIEGARAITEKTKNIRQPTDQELFGHLVKTQEELDEMEKAWENFFNDTLNEAREDIDEKVKKELPPELQEEAWPSGTSFNDMLSDEEKEERGRYVGR